MTRNLATGSRIQTETDLAEFFRERVDVVADHQKTPVSRETRYYISGLLADQGHADAEPPGPTTLVELQAAAVNAPYARAVGLWRTLGDRALVIRGYFREHLEHRRLSPTYYETMGAGAYARLGTLLGGPEEGFGAIFQELSRCFQECAELITEVRHEVQPCNDADVIKLYEEYIRTGSPRVGERLKKLGVVPTRICLES